MAKLKNLFFILLTLTVMTGSTILVGCSSGPSEEQMKELNDCKAAVDALQQQVNAKNDEKSNLQKQISDMDAKTKEMQGLAEAVRKNCQ